ncbi:hypothetical protein EV143_101476 [Flavobacterium chryseum]|uniref:hypothetical protein n=1 Tax=Flavobacterium sp. P3160 TaxID=2512113 RepID=UPI00105B8372|nr:hypothetical protein [Flavobacterium sp. P3160]TDO84031.1 hypothetical protein EV143_101476 [Flavobacterium sp. P3160]
MKKILLLIVLYSSASYCQENKHPLESIIDISIRLADRDSTFYKFENGKLISRQEIGRKPTFYFYNQNGLLEKESITYDGGETQEVFYTYNSDGYITEIVKSGKKDASQELIPWHKNVISYTFINNNNFVVTSVSDYTPKPTGENLRVYEIKDGVLKTSSKQGKFYSENQFKIEKGNIVTHERTKPSKENYVTAFKFDDKENVFKMLFKNMFGSKYFMNQMLAQNNIYDHYDDYISENNCLSLRNVKTTKNVSISEKTSTIKYNKENLPVEIKLDSDPGFGNLFIIKYKN